MSTRDNINLDAITRIVVEDKRRAFFIVYREFKQSRFDKLFSGEKRDGWYDCLSGLYLTPSYLDREGIFFEYGKAMHKPRVTIFMINGTSQDLLFDTFQGAIDYFNRVTSLGALWVDVPSSKAI